jgi:signal transduction histidine kinase
LPENAPDVPSEPEAPLRGLFTTRALRLRTRFILSFTSMIVAIMTFVILLVETRLGDILKKQAEKRGLSMARNLAAVCQPSLVTYNYVALTQNAERAQREQEGIAAVIILNKEGRVAAYSQHSERQNTVLKDPLSIQAVAARGEVVVPVALEGGERGLDIAVPVYIENSQEKWGTVRIRLSTEDMYRQLRETRLALAALGLLAVGLGALGSFVLARRITKPLSTLVAGTIRAAGGDLEARIGIKTGDEIEELARNFNDMVRQIQANQGKIEELNKGLEEKVRIRTDDFSATNDALKRAYAELQQAEVQLVHSEKMASLGQFVAGIAHEINTPSSAINAAIFNMRGYLHTLAQQIPALSGEGVPAGIEARFYRIIGAALSPDLTKKRSSTSEIRRRTRALETALAKQGFKSPRELALTFSRLALHEELLAFVAAGGDKAPPHCLAFLENVGNLAIAVGDVRLSIEAITRMVKALRSYSHPDQADMREADIHDGIETTLTILRNQIKYGIVVERRYSRLPALTCNTNELNQVWTNIIHNAIQAMKGMGRITIETYRKDGFLAVRISDTGPGIPPAIRGRIFDPFFTTKDQGEGSGLGLGIAQQIVERHKGQILVESEPGWTAFEVLLPLEPEVVAAKP